MVNQRHRLVGDNTNKGKKTTENLKPILSILLVFLFTGCAILGTNVIHSPSSKEGSPWKHRHTHGGATKKAPPDGVTFEINDFTLLVVSARVILVKKNFGGILLPIFPIFWLPKINHYEDEPNRLIIELSTIGDELEIDSASATLISNGESFEIQEIRTTWEKTELVFALSAEETTAFELRDLTLIINKESKELPMIAFRKMKQRWRFVGP